MQSTPAVLELRMGYPSAADEKRMLVTYDQPPPPVRPVIGPSDVLEVQALARHHVRRGTLARVAPCCPCARLLDFEHGDRTQRTGAPRAR